MGEIIPSMSNSDLHTHHQLKSLKTIAEIYLSKDASRTEQLNTANAIVATGLMQLTQKKPDLSSLEECQNAFASYTTICAEKNVRPTITGIAIALGVSRKQFLEVCETGQITYLGSPSSVALPSSVHEFFIGLRDNYIAMIEGFMEANVIHPTSGSFLLKNNGAYKDTIEHNYNVTKTVVDMKALEEKYRQESNE